MSGVNYYELFSLPSDASLADIRQRYRTLSLTHHPDRGGTTEHMARLNAAYRTLSNPQLRYDYDQTLLRQSDEFTGGYRMTTYTTPVRTAVADEPIVPNLWTRFAIAIVLGIVILAYSIMNNIVLPNYIDEIHSTAPPSMMEITEPHETDLSRAAEDAAGGILPR